MKRFNSIGKPPKLRYRPGQFFKHNKTNQLYCCLFAFRLKDTPHIWYFLLEERINMGDPSTPLSIMCALSSVDTHWENRIQYQPFDSEYDACVFLRDYAYGDRWSVSNQNLINNFELVSSGEVY